MSGMVTFRTAGAEGDERLIREYVFEAMDRLPEQPGCEGVAFNPLARKARLSEFDAPGGVLLRIWGRNAESVITRERDRWDELVEAGLADSWEWVPEEGELADYMGANGAERYRELHSLASHLSRKIYSEFDERPDPVDEYPDEDRHAPAGVGWWRLLHLLTIQQNYRYAQEIDAYTEGIRSTVHTLAEFDSEESALRTLEGVIESLQALQTELQS